MYSTRDTLEMMFYDPFMRKNVQFHPSHSRPQVRMKSAALASSVALAISTIIAPPAFAGHYIQVDSVDGNEIRFENRTRYDQAWGEGRGEWNALNRINIAPDAAFNNTDLIVGDNDRCEAVWAARYTPQGGSGSPDYIHANVCFFKDFSLKKKRYAFMHEIGHALGLGDHESYGYYNILMYYTFNDVVLERPSQHDVDDYREKNYS